MGLITSIVLTAASVAYQYHQAKKARKRAEAAKDAAAGIKFQQKGQSVALPIYYGYCEADAYAVYWRITDEYIHSPSSLAYESFSPSVELETRSIARALRYREGLGFLTNTVVMLSNSRDMPWSYAAQPGLSIENNGLDNPASGVTIRIFNSDRLYTEANEVSIVLRRNSTPWDPADAITPSLSGSAKLARQKTNIQKYWVFVDPLSEISNTANRNYKLRRNNTNNYYDWYHENGLNNNHGGDRNECLFAQYVICPGTISDVVGLKIDGKSAGEEDFEDHRIHIKNAVASAPPDPLITSNVEGRANARFPNITYINSCFRINRDEPQYAGIPELTLLIKGQPLYDVSFNSTTGVYSLVTSRTFSNNSARVLLTYLLDTISGRGLSVSKIDLKSFYEAIQICEFSVLNNVSFSGYNAAFRLDSARWTETITDSVKRYTFNGSLDSSATARENINIILESMNDANLVFSEGKFKLVLYYPRNDTQVADLSVMNITDNDLMVSDVTISYPSLDNRLNYCSVSFKDGNRKLVSNTAEWPERGGSVHDIYLEEDNNNPLNSSLTADYICESYTAKAKAEYIVRYSRTATEYKFKIGRRGLLLTPGDIIQLQSVHVAKLAYLKVEEISANPDFTFDVTASYFGWEYLAWNVADDDPGELLEDADTWIPVTGPVVSPGRSGVQTIISGTISWDPLRVAGRQHYVVWLTDVDHSYRRDLGTTTSTTFELPPLSTGVYVIGVDFFVNNRYYSTSFMNYVVTNPRLIGGDDVDHNSITSNHIADNAITANQIAEAAIDVAAFAAGIEPVTIWTEAALPTTRRTNAIFWNGGLYRWNGSAYTASVNTSLLEGTIDSALVGAIEASQITGQLNAEQIAAVHAASLLGQLNNEQLMNSVVTSEKLANLTVRVEHLVNNAVTEAKLAANAVTTEKLANGAISATKFASGIEPVSIVTGSVLPTVRTTNAIYFQNKLYRWNGSAYTASINTVDLEGKLEAAQINSLAAEQITGQLNNSQINSINAAKLAGQIIGSQIAPNAITASKLANLPSGNLILDEFFKDQDSWIPQTTTRWSFTGGTWSFVGSSTTTGTNLLSYRVRVPIEEGANYKLETGISLLTAGSVLLREALVYYDRDGVQLATIAPVWGNTFTGVAGDKFSRTLASFEVPANTAFMLYRVQVNHVSTTANFRLEKASVIKRTNAMDLVDNAVTAAALAANSVTTAAIIANAITSVQLAQDSVNEAAIAANAVTSTEISNNAITTPKIVAGAVQANSIAANAINANHIAANSITANEIAANAITASELAANAVTTNHLAANSVTANQLVANAVTASAIAANTITAVEIAANAITASELAANSVYTNSIIANAVTANQIAANAVTANAIAANSIVAEDIAANAIQARNINANAINAAHLSAGSVEANAIAANAVTANAIAANSVTANAVEAGAITAGKIAAGAVSANEIAANAITTSKLALTDLTNFVPDSSFVDLAAWNKSAAIVFDSVNGKLVFPLSSTNLTITSKQFAVEPGVQYWFGTSVLPLGAVGNGTARVRLQLRWLDQQGTQISWTPNRDANYDSGSTSTISWSGTAPAGAVRAQFQVIVLATSTVSTEVMFPFCRRKGGSELIVDGAITSEKIAANSILGNHVAANSIAGNSIVANSITALELQANSVAANEIAANSVYTNAMQANSVNAVSINAGSINTNHITSNSIWSNTINSNAVQTVHVSANAIDGSRINAGSINAIHIISNSIDARHINANAIQSNHITANSITAGKIAAGAVSADQIAANAIIASKLAVQNISNQVPDPDIQDANSWSIYAASNNVILNTNYGTSNPNSGSKGVFVIDPGGANATTIQGSTFKVEPGDEFVVAYKSAQASAATTTVTINGGIQYLDTNGAWLANHPVAAVGSAWVSGYNKRNSVAPEGAAYARFFWSIPAGYYGGVRNYVGSPIIRRKNEGELIVDGAIQANHINVVTLSAVSAIIGILRTATSGSRMEIRDNRILIYEGNVLRVKIGNLG